MSALAVTNWLPCPNTKCTHGTASLFCRIVEAKTPKPFGVNTFIKCLGCEVTGPLAWGEDLRSAREDAVRRWNEAFVRIEAA